MQAAANRSAALKRARADQNRFPGLAEAVDDHALLQALPIAAGIFSLKDGKLWVEALNDRFFDLAGCDGSPEKFASMFHHYADGPAGRLTLAYLKDPASAPDETEYSEGEGLARRFLRFKLSPLEAKAGGVPRCLLSVVDRTLEVQAENNLRAECCVTA